MRQLTRFVVLTLRFSCLDRGAISGFSVNLSNAAAVMGGAAPVFNVVGPFTYTRNVVKVDPQFFNGGTQVSYFEQIQYSFVPDQSVLDESALITNFYPFYFGVLANTGSETGLLLSFFPTVLSSTLNALAGLYSGNMTAAYVQWGSLGMNNGTNLPGFGNAELPYPPSRVISLSLAATTSLLTGARGLLGSPNNVITLMSLAAKADFGTIVSLWPELGSAANAGVLVQYVQFLLQSRVAPFVSRTFFTGGTGSGAIVTHAVSQWLWTYTDPLLAALSPSTASAAHLQTNYSTSEQARASAGLTAKYTGSGSIDEIGTYTLWRNASSVTGYNPAGPLGGTDGTQFRPRLSSGDPLTVFITEAGRPVQIRHTSSPRVKAIPTMKYMLEQAELLPNPQYYSTVLGLFNATAVSNGLPVDISMPYFLYADPSLAAAAGLTPDPARDDTFLCVEPLSGVVMQARLRLQLNVRVNSSQTNVFSPNLASGVWPIADITRQAIISDADAQKFIDSVLRILKVRLALLVICVALAVLAAAACVAVLLQPRCCPVDAKGTYRSLGEGAPLMRQ